MSDDPNPTGTNDDRTPATDEALPLPSRMNELERQVGYIGAGLAGLMFIVVWALVYGVGSSGLQYVGYGLLCAVALAVAASWRNRYVGAFACVFIAGLRVPYAINLAYFILAGWYILRATRVARETAQARAEARRAARRARQGDRPRGRTASRAKSKKQEAVSTSGRQAPKPSKRYTPPKR